MSFFHYFVILTICLIFITAIAMSFLFRSRLRGMSSMILSMAIGTSIGLTVGVLFGSLFQGNLFHSTLYSVLLGIFVGAVLGIIFGIVPSLEGSMGGLMGGMMGAMLGEMIIYDQSIIMINLLLALTVSSLFLFPILSGSSNKGEKIQTKKWIFKPFFILFFLSSYLLIGSQLDKQMLSKSNSSQQQIHHLNNKSDLVKKENTPLEWTIKVLPSQFSYNPSEVTLKKGEKVSLILKNEDTIEHDIEIKDISFSGGESLNHQNHINNKTDFHLHAPAKKQTKLTFTPLEQGTYEFYCTIPGHKENGMVGLLIIS